MYFTSHCIVEAFHVHVSDKNLTEAASAKFYVYEDGTSKITHKGRLKETTLREIQEFIQTNYEDMYKTWIEHSGKSEFYKKK